MQVSPEDIYTTIAIQWKFKSSPLGTFTSQQFINGCQELGYEPFIIFGALYGFFTSEPTVPKSEYDLLVNEKNALQSELSKLNKLC